MEQLSSILLKIHIIAGFLSIVIFWIPTLTKKGGKIHRQVGKLYVGLMATVIITAAMLSIRNLYIGAIDRAIFLGFLTFITSRPLWFGVAILNHKKSLPKYLYNINLGIQIAIFIFGIMMLAYGISLKGEGYSVVMIAFGIIGLSSGKEVWDTWKKGNTTTNWITEHIDGMMTSAIAAYTAFLVFGSYRFLSQFIPESLVFIPWILPSIVGVFLIKKAKKKYQ